MASPHGDEVTDPTLPRKTSLRVRRCPYRITDTGGLVENTKARERTLVKELGKIAS
jgi:hypothetical protein